MNLTDQKPRLGRKKPKIEHLNDETVVLFVERALMWTEHLFPDESIKKLDHIIAGNLFITFGIDHKKTEEILTDLRELRNKYQIYFD